MSAPSPPSAELEDFIARATAPGTLAALPALFAPPEHRPTLAVAFALRGEIGRSLAPQLAPEVAATRLSWWGEEAGRVVAGQARHPLTRHLLEATTSSALGDGRRLGSLLAEMIGAAQATLADPVPATWDALTHRLDHDWGALCRLISRAVSPADTVEAPWHEGWGNALGAACAVEEALAGTPIGELPALSPSAETGTVETRAGAWRQYALGRLGDGGRALAVDARAGQRALLVLASLVVRRLQQPLPSPGTPSLSRSLGDLWCAWRAAQRAARGQLPSPVQRAAAVDCGA